MRMKAVTHRVRAAAGFGGRDEPANGTILG